MAKKKKTRKSSDIRIPLTKRERAALDAKAGGDAVKFVKSRVLHSCLNELKDRGRPGNRTHPKESAPTAADKTAAPPGRGQPSTLEVEADKASRFARSRRKRRRGKAEHDYDLLTNLLLDQDDRECAIIAVAMIDDMLLSALRSLFAWRCLEPESLREPHFGSLLIDKQPPIGSLYSRTLACFALGLIDERTRQILEILRDIRNDAAHLADKFCFDEQLTDTIWSIFPVKERFAVAMYWGTVGDDKVPYLSHLRNLPDGETATKIDVASRDVFVGSCMLIYCRLATIAGNPDVARQALSSGYVDDIINPKQIHRKESGSSDSEHRTA